MKPEIRAWMIAALAAVGAAGNAGAAQPVLTESGALSGVREHGLVVYKGVPFAAAPLRIRTPERCSGAHRLQSALQVKRGRSSQRPPESGDKRARRAIARFESSIRNLCAFAEKAHRFHQTKLLSPFP